MYPNGKETHLFSYEEMGKFFQELDLLETEELEHAVIPLAMRLQFEFAALRSEIIELQWNWIVLENRRVVSLDSKTGGMSKHMSEEAYRLLSATARNATTPMYCRLRVIPIDL